MLLKRIGETDPSTLEDLILIMARNIEKSLIDGGAIPGKDYTMNNLYSWAMPFAVEVFKSKCITYTASNF